VGDAVRWASATIDSGRFNGWFMDEGALSQANPLAADEAALLRQLNAPPRSTLKALCAAARVDCAEPLAVGVDPGGIDIRRLHDVARLPFPSRLERPAQVRDLLAARSA
jgi:hypothetical protein